MVEVMKLAASVKPNERFQHKWGLRISRSILPRGTGEWTYSWSWWVRSRVQMALWWGGSRCEGIRTIWRCL